MTGIFTFDGNQKVEKRKLSVEYNSSWKEFIKRNRGKTRAGHYMIPDKYYKTFYNCSDWKFESQFLLRTRMTLITSRLLSGLIILRLFRTTEREGQQRQLRQGKRQDATTKTQRPVTHLH